MVQAINALNTSEVTAYEIFVQHRLQSLQCICHTFCDLVYLEGYSDD